MCAHSQTENSLAPPIAPIMPRLPTGFCEIGEFIAPVSGRAEARLHPLHHARRLLAGEDPELATGGGAGEGSAGLENEFVGGEMSEPQGNGLFEIRLPHGLGLVQGGKDQVDRNILETRGPGLRQGAPDLIRAMGAPQGLEEGIVKGLHSDREPSDSRFPAKIRQAFPLKKTRIDLQRDLHCFRRGFSLRRDFSPRRGASRHRKSLLDGRADSRQGIGAQQGGRATPEVESREPMPREDFPPPRQFTQQAIDVRILDIRPIGTRHLPRLHRFDREVAIGTDPRTKGNVDIDAYGGGVHDSTVDDARAPWGLLGYSRPTPLSDLDVHYRKLDNGLTLLLRETHLAPVANLQIWAQVGSADERPGEEGLAHFHEHMLFKGTESRGVGEVAGEIEGAGGRVNAYTSFDMTVYYATVPSRALDTAVDVLTDALLRSVFDPREIEREQQVVIEEIRRSQDSPGHVLSDLCFRQSYRLHPYRAPILGTMESVGGLNREKCLAFFRRWYAPENLICVAAGDFDARVLGAQLEQSFMAAKAGGATRQRLEEPAPDAARSIVERRSFEAQRFELAWPSVRFRDEDASYLDLLSFVLGECESSRLVRGIRENDALVDRIDSSSYTPYDPGLFSINFESNEQRSRHALEAVAAAVERLRIEPVEVAELERARTNFLASEHFERESVSGLASKLGSHEVLGGDWRKESRHLEIVRNASREDLLRVAQKYLDAERIAAAALIPDQGGESLDADALTDALTAGVERAHSLYRAPRGQSIAKPASRAAAGRSVGRKKSGNDEILSYELPGGGALHVAPRGAVPVVAVRAAFRGGLLAETEESCGLSSFLAAMWSRGTQRHSAADFAGAVEDLAADIRGFSGRSSLGLSLETTSENLSPALDLFRDVLLEPRFAQEELERERRETLAAIDRREDQLAQRAFMLFSASEFSQHPYRLPMLGLRPSVEGFTVEAVRNHHDRLIGAPNLVIGVAGDVDPDEVAREFETRLADLPRDVERFDALPPEPLSTQIRENVEHKDRAQAHLVLGFRGLTVDDPDRHTLDVISQVLAGQSGRLFLELRDRRSLAYSVSAMSVEGADPGFFVVYIATSPDKVDEARSGILEELEKLLEAAPAEAELERSRQNLMGNFLIDQQRSAARASQIALNGLYDLGPRAHLNFPKEIASVGAADILRVARRVIRPDAYTLAIVRP